MKYILAALCGLAVLFMGGCAVLSVMAMPFPVIPGGIAFLNLAMLAVLFNWKNLQWRPAFYILGAADILIAAVSFFIAKDFGASDGLLLQILGGGFLVKGVLSLVYILRNKGVST